MKTLLLAAMVLLTMPILASARTPAICTMQYEPVCGEKQVQCIKAPCYPVYHTYGNSCTMSAEKGVFIHAGECTAEETGPIVPKEPYVPPANCTAWFDGCNSCSKNPNGSVVCTLRACAEPAAGYCTAHSAVDKPVVVEESGASTSTLTVTPVQAQSFLSSLWNFLTAWLKWL
jgi:hypothetical protein